MKRTLIILCAVVLLVACKSARTTYSVDTLVCQLIQHTDTTNLLSDTTMRFLQHWDLSQTVLYKKPSYNIHTRFVETEEPLGFCGDNYQRFYIHWDTIYKQTPRIYRIEGRTRCKDEYCAVYGITVIDSVYFDWTYFIPELNFRCGEIHGHYTMIALQDDTPVGKLQGEAIHYFFEKNDTLFYSTSNEDDAQCGREHRGVWIDMRNNDTLRCNWGDLDIPDCGDLNIGWGCFLVNKKYYDYGWQTLYDSEHIGSTKEPSHAYYDSINTIDKNWWK